jgi:hypothetical protein
VLELAIVEHTGYNGVEQGVGAGISGVGAGQQLAAGAVSRVGLLGYLVAEGDVIFDRKQGASSSR